MNLLARIALLIRVGTGWAGGVLPSSPLTLLRIVECLDIVTVLPNMRSLADLLFIVLNFRLMARLLIVWCFMD